MWQDYLWAYFGHHYGGGFHDIKHPCGSWAPFFDRFREPHGWSRFELATRTRYDSSVWIFGVTEPSRGGVACRESAASDDPACLALRAKRGESAHRFRSLLKEFDDSYIDRRIDDWDRTRGACCERVRDNFEKTLQVQQHIVRPRTPLTSDWLRLAHASLDYKAERIARHRPPAHMSRCCMKHEGGYPVNWAELKGEIIFSLHVKYAEHVRSGMPLKPLLNYRDRSEDGKSRFAKPPYIPRTMMYPPASGRLSAESRFSRQQPRVSSAPVQQRMQEAKGSDSLTQMRVNRTRHATRGKGGGTETSSWLSWLLGKLG